MTRELYKVRDRRLGSDRRTRSPWITSWIASTQIQRQLLGAATEQRMVHLEQVMANDDHLAALSAKARAEMPEPSRG